MEGHWLSVSVHAKRLQTNGSVDSFNSKTPDHKTQEGNSKTGTSSKVLGLPTESHRYADKQTHTVPTMVVSFFSFFFF